MNNLTTETLIELDDLLEQWLDLTIDSIKEESFDYNLFKDVFIKTYKIVCHLSHQQMIRKEYIELFAVAKEFEATHFICVNDEHQAACQLTHELLKDCFELYYKEGTTPVMTDLSGKEYSYEDVDTLIELIKNDL